MKHNKKAIKPTSHAEVFFLSISAAYPKQRDLEQRHLKMTSSFGFTLVELLVVVLIIGILSAIAIPMYQGAVDKSHWSTMLPASKAIKDAEEAFKMTNGEYSDTMEHLDVQISNADLTFTLNTPNNMSEPNVIKVTNIKLDNVRLASYLDDSPLFAGQLHCEAETGNERAQKLCKKLLGGQELTAADGYTGYLLDQAIDKITCENANRFYGQKTNTCYKTNAERCVGLDMPYNPNTQFCGYRGQNNVQVEEGGICYATSGNCNLSQFSNGAICKSITFGYNSCMGGQFDNNSLCISYMTGCGPTAEQGSTFSNNSVCYAGDNHYGALGCAQATYNDTSCCCGGASCPVAHRCSDSRCATVEKQVQEIEAQYK